jgi:predicted acylesterase/phospholipase RssA
MDYLKKFLLIFTISLIPLTSFAEKKIYYTISGGAALGSYEAGFLFYLDSLLAVNKRAPKLTHLTGASAGAYTSLLSIFTKCGLERNLNPKKSLYWDGWTPLSINKIFKKESVRPDQLFTLREGLDILPKLKKIWGQGFKKDCDMILGVAVTRFNPTGVKVNKYVEVPNMEEVAVIRIKGRGKGKPPLLSNFKFKNGVERQILIPFTGDNETDYNQLVDLIMASVAFPLAFPPVKLKYCLKKGRTKYFPCKGKKIKEKYFVDGGVFNNAPLLLSYQIGKELGAKKDDLFVWVNPNYYIYKEHSKKPEKRHESFFGYVRDLSKNFVNTSSTRDLSFAAEWIPQIKSRLINSSVSLPPASAPLSHFFGFFDRGFREFDFYLGMVDAFSFVQAHKNRGHIDYPGVDNSDEWIPYFCIKDIVVGNKKARKICEKGRHKLPHNFFANLQVSLDQLYSKCHTFKHKPKYNLHCVKGFRGEKPPVVIEQAKDFKDWRKKEGEKELDYVFRLYERYNYHFEDLGLKPNHANRGNYSMRRKLGEIKTTFVDSLPGDEQLVLKKAGTTFLNTEVYYIPKESQLFFTLGSAVELGWNFARWDLVFPTYVKTNIGLLYQGAQSFLTDIPDIWALTPLLGLEFELPMSNNNRQFLFGLKAGYQFSKGDQISDTNCDETPLQRSAVTCAGVSVLPFLGFSYLELLRVHLYYNWMPQFDSSDVKGKFLLQIGVQI